MTIEKILIIDHFAKIQNVLLAGNTTIENSFSNYQPLPKGGILVLGQDQDILGGGFDMSQSLSGRLTQFGVWDRVLEDEEIINVASCKIEMVGNVFGWDNFLDDWEVSSDASLKNEDMEMLCQEDSLKVFCQRLLDL